MLWHSVLILRFLRYVPTDPQLLNWTIPCQHNKKKVYQCRDIDNETLIFAKNYFYKDNSTNAQNVRLASLLKIAKPARDRNRHANTYKPHELQVQYTVSLILFLCERMLNIYIYIFFITDNTKK